MKRHFFILFFSLVYFSATAQNVLDRTLNFRAKNEPLEDVLYALTDAAEVNISFSNSILPADKKVSISVKRKTVRYILTEILINTNLKFILSADNRILLVEKPKPPSSPRLTINGYLLDGDSGEPLIGAAIQDTITGKGTFSNAYGFYSLTLPSGEHFLKVSYLGYQSRREKLTLYQKQSINFELTPTITLEEVIIYASDASFISEPEKIGTEEIYLKQLRNAPGIAGENDVVRAVQQMTGVQSGADGYGGFTVRGGNVDQNLVLLDGVPVYNASHALGLYSIFNPATVSRTKVVKGVFPARYGGRISSVLDVRTKEGNNRKLSGEGEIGPLSGSLLLEGPIVSEKSSFLVSYRRSFIDFYTRPIYKNRLETDSTSGGLSYYFYDINAKVNHQLSSKDKVYLSFYSGEDRFKDEFKQQGRINFFAPNPSISDTIADITLLEDRKWGNVIASGRWNHTFTDKIFANTTFTYTRFNFERKNSAEQLNSIGGIAVDTLSRIQQLNSNNQDIAGKIDFDFHPSSEHHLLFGVGFTAHQFQPRIIQVEGNVPLDTFNLLLENRIERKALRSYEYDAYVEDEWVINKRWRINPGIRFSIIQSLGKNYYAFQPRFTFTYRVAKRFYIQGGAGYVVQPVHLLTTTGQGRAEDLWVSATSRFKPIEAKQYTLGFELRPKNYWTFSVEGYVKEMENLISFQEGLIQNIDATSWQNAVVAGRGDASGVEFSIKKNQGKFTGYVNYTYATSTRQFPERNQGKSYRHQFDRRHNFNISFNQEMSKRVQFNATFVYQSGALTTVPQASYLFTVPSLFFPFRGRVLVYSELSNVELPTYHRMDVGATFSWSEKPVKHLLKVGIYNLYNRQNPSFYNVSSECENSNFCYKQTTLVPIMPYVRYRVKF
ncbi:MAG: outer membrane receptor for ferrienterochelin and colicin [Saprospiraceae bacterium]